LRMVVFPLRPFIFVRSPVTMRRLRFRAFNVSPYLTAGRMPDFERSVRAARLLSLTGFSRYPWKTR
jgi:hypothetical protein